MRQLRESGYTALLTVSACHRDWSFSLIAPDASEAPIDSGGPPPDASDAASLSDVITDSPADVTADYSDASEDPEEDSSTGCISGEGRCLSSPERCVNGAWIAEKSLPGSCQKMVCAGDGGTLTVADPENSDDGNDCTTDSCAGGIPVHTITPAESCGTQGVCDTLGVCAKVVAGCGDVSGLLALSPWPRIGYCPTHVGRSPYVGPKHMAIKTLSNPINGTWGGSAVQDTDSTLYLSGASDARLRAVSVSATSVQVLWDFAPVLGAACTALGADRTIYAIEAVSKDGATLHAVTPPNGMGTPQEKWALPLGGSTTGCPVIGGNGLVYVGAGNDIVAVSKDGKKKWSFTAGDRIESPSVALDGTVLAPSADHRLYAFNPDYPSSAATPVATFEADSAVTTSAVIAPDGTAFIGSEKGTLYALNSAKELLHKSPFSVFPVAGGPLITPALAEDGTLFFGAGDFYEYAVRWEVDHFVKKWDFFTCGNPRGGTFLDAEGTVYVSVLDYCVRFYALDPKTGQEISHVDDSHPVAGITPSGLIAGVRSAGPDTYQFRVKVTGEQ